MIKIDDFFVQVIFESRNINYGFSVLTFIYDIFFTSYKLILLFIVKLQRLLKKTTKKTNFENMLFVVRDSSKWSGNFFFPK